MLVDDEHQALHALKRSLLDTDPFLMITILTNGRDALEQLAFDPHDVLITDLWLTGMDGITLLKQVQQNYPEIVRILVDGHSDDATLFKSLHIAHQVAGKPVDSQLLWSLISQTAALLPLVSDATMRRVIGSVSQLPAAPKLYRELSFLLQRSDCTKWNKIDLVSVTLRLAVTCSGFGVFRILWLRPRPITTDLTASSHRSLARQQLQLSRRRSLMACRSTKRG